MSEKIVRTRFEIFKKKLEQLINHEGIDAACGVPDFILAEHMGHALYSFKHSHEKNLKYHGIPSGSLASLEDEYELPCEVHLFSLKPVEGQVHSGTSVEPKDPAPEPPAEVPTKETPCPECGVIGCSDLEETELVCPDCNHEWSVTL